jgi:2-keto-3-deoxy-L-rhamnonate aldolase RhmA
MKKNSLRELIKAGKPTWGTHVNIPWPRHWEIVCNTGAFDYIEFGGENSTYSLEQFENLARAVELYPNMSSMIKVEEQTRGYISTRAIGAGIQNVLFTDCRSAKDVRECISYVLVETPDRGGIHGCNARRIMVGSNHDEWAKAMDDVVIAIMIEKKGAVQDLEEILSIKRVDMVQFGPSDYAVSCGITKTRTADGKRPPEIAEMQKKVIKMALDHGVAPRVEVASVEEAKPFIELGVRHFCMGWDIFMVRDWCIQKGKDIRALNLK